MKYKILIIILVLLVIDIASAQEKNIFIEVNIEPRGVVSTEYNVVGDIFTYNISLFNNNNNSEVYKDNISIEIFAPGERKIGFDKEITSLSPDGKIIITSLPIVYNISIEAYKTESLIPYTNLSKNKEVRIWPFDVAGDYYIKICSSNFQTIFFKWYNIQIDENHFYKSYYYFPNCFSYYFSVMPKWQYLLFEKEYSAAKESLDASKKSLDANPKSLDLNIELGRATNSMLLASWLMFVVALITLYISASNEEEKETMHYKFITEFIVTILGTIILMVILFGLVGILGLLFQNWVWIPILIILIISVIVFFVRKKDKTIKIKV